MPAPAPATAVPIWLAAGQAGDGLLGEAGVARSRRAAASADSGQYGIPVRVAAKPGGVVTSGRVRF